MNITIVCISDEHQGKKSDGLLSCAVSKGQKKELDHEIKNENQN